MYSTNSPSTGRGTRRTVICATVHGQTASKTNIVSVTDAPFQPPRGLWAQLDTLHDAHALEHSMIVLKNRETEKLEIRPYVGQKQALVTYQRPPQLFRLGNHDAPSGSLEVSHTMDYDGFQSLNDQLCRNNRCDGDNEPDAPDAAHP